MKTVTKVMKWCVRFLNVNYCKLRGAELETPLLGASCTSLVQVTNASTRVSSAQECQLVQKYVKWLISFGTNYDITYQLLY